MALVGKKRAHEVVDLDKDLMIASAAKKRAHKAVDLDELDEDIATENTAESSSL